jgi:hypothetical protein
MSTAAIASPPRRGRYAVPAEHILLGVGPVVVSVLLLLFQIRIHAVAVDFHSVYYAAAERLMHGGNPYTVSASDVAHARSFVYPALGAILFVPFALLGRVPGELVATALCIASVPAALRALGVRDWRIYGIAMLWLPVYSGWQTANLLIALAWRHRDRPLVAGLITAVAISIKPFVWPLALWLIATRRLRASGWTLILGIAINLVSWSVVGFGRIGDLVRMSSRDTDAMWHAGYGVIATLHHLSLGRSAGEAALLLASAILVVLVLGSGLRGNERRALTLAVVLMLVASPLVWTHYLALLIAPLALARPRLVPVWAAPIALWVCPPTTGVHGWQLAVLWIVAAICVRAALTGPGAQRGARTPDLVALAPAET